MPKLVVKGQGPLDGEYECEIDNFNGDELHEIKVLSGVRAGEITEAFLAGDSDLTLAMAIVVLRRMGRHPDPRELWASEYGSILFDFTPNGNAEPEPTLPPKKPSRARAKKPESSGGSND